MKQGPKIHEFRFLPLFILAMLANIISQATHETGHRLVYQFKGHDPVWGFTKLVQIWDKLPLNPDEWVETMGPEGEQGWLKLSFPVESESERFLIAAAGPLAGLLGAILGLILARWSKKITWKQIGLAYSLSASLAAALYYLRSPMRSGGDEYEIAGYLGVAKSAIEIPLALAFVGCLIMGLYTLPSLRDRFSWLGTVFLGSAATGLLMALSDPLVIAQVDAGNPWFQPVVGYALPVFLVNMLALLGFWVWARWQGGEVDDDLFGVAGKIKPG